MSCATNAAVPSCTPNNSVNNAVAFHVYPTYVYQGNICLPTDGAVRKVVLTALGRRFLESIFGSVTTDWSIFLIMVPIMLGMSLVAMLLIRVTAGWVIYIFYALLIIAFVGFAVFLLIPTTPSAGTFILKQSRLVAIMVAVLSLLIAVLVIVVFCSFRERIHIAVDYINQANEFFKTNCQIIFLPFFLTALLTAFLYFWIFLVFAFSTKTVPVTAQNQLPFQHFRLTTWAVIGLMVSLFYLLWGTFVLMHSSTFVVSGTMVSFAFQREDCYKYAYRTYLASHIGSVCFGSFFTCLLGAFKVEHGEEHHVKRGLCRGSTGSIMRKRNAATTARNAIVVSAAAALPSFSTSFTTQPTATRTSPDFPTFTPPNRSPS